jgi:hypothetical protein
MFKLPVRTWVRNAAAVFSGQHGTVTQQAREAGCSRETVYEHARQVEQRLARPSSDDDSIIKLKAKIDQLRQVIAEWEQRARHQIGFGSTEQQRFAVTAFAMGVSLRQTEDLLNLLLTPGKAPHHATLGRWVAAEAKNAKHVLQTLDAACLPRVQTLALDEIFFGGARPWSASNRRA